LSNAKSDQLGHLFKEVQIENRLGYKTRIQLGGCWCGTDLWVSDA